MTILSLVAGKVKTRQGSATMTTRKIDNRIYCPQCEASLTETDFECGYCTNCGRELEPQLINEKEIDSWEHEV